MNRKAEFLELQTSLDEANEYPYLKKDYRRAFRRYAMKRASFTLLVGALAITAQAIKYNVFEHPITTTVPSATVTVQDLPYTTIEKTFPATTGFSPAQFQPYERISPQRHAITIFKRNLNKHG